jgi:uncharacterized DUF497 family protein
MHFEFDERKNQLNQDKHHLSFEEATAIWDDPDLIVLHAKKRGEKRLLAIGCAYTVLYSVVHTVHGETTRIISARRSTERERRTYERYKDI